MFIERGFLGNDGNDTQDQVRVWPAVCDEQLALLAL